MLSAIPHSIIVWDGDSASMGRHALLLAVFARLGLILATLDALVYLRDPAIQSKVCELMAPRAHRSVSTLKAIALFARIQTR